MDAKVRRQVHGHCPTWHGFEGASIDLAGEGASKPSPPDAESGDAMAARNANGLEGLSIDGLSIDCLSGAR